MKEQRPQHAALLSRMEATGQTEVPLTDPDCRMRRTHRTCDLCCNTQIAVEAKSKLIVEYDVTNHPFSTASECSAASR